VTFGINKFERIIRRFRPVEELKEKVTGALERFYRGIRNISNNRRLLVASLVISFFLWLTVLVRLKMVFLALGENQSLLILNVVAVAMVFAGYIPFLPGGLAVTETLMLALFVRLGVEADVSGSAVFIDRVISYWLMTLVGAISSVYLGIRFKVLDWKQGDG
jgi:uncharacterized protein (TIRG00374 family)